MTRAIRVLIIDDEIEFAGLLGAILDEEGYQTTLAHDGLEGLDLALKSHPNLVIVDAAMPGMDGYELCRRLRADPQTSELPVLMLTGRTFDSELNEAREAGADACLTKPCEPPELLSTLEQLMRVPREPVHADPAPSTG
jgi:CheY-like chemotaxis protein